jgi:hypothetical protein
MRIAVSQLDGSKTTLNNSASWIVDSWDSRVSCSPDHDALLYQ